MSARGAPGAPRVVIVGGGASGTLLAAALLRQAPAVEVTLVEPRPDLGRASPTPRRFWLIGSTSARAA